MPVELKPHNARSVKLGWERLADYPFWLPDQRHWVEAKDLAAGSVLQTSTGSRVQVTAIKKRIAIERVHNLTVDDIHTYHVVARVEPVLVHNQNVGVCSVNGLPHGKLGEAATRQRLEHAGYTNRREH